MRKDENWDPIMRGLAQPRNPGLAAEMSLPTISIYDPRGQCITMLLAALRELGGSVSKREAVGFISERRWFAIEPDDMRPYPSQVHTKEARWKTLIAWGRKDSVLRNLVLDHERDSWALSRDGVRCWDAHRAKFASGDHDVRRGFLWSPAFKGYLYPQYVPSSSDVKRPWRFYDDVVDFKRLVDLYR